MPVMTIIDVHGQKKVVTGTLALQKEVNHFEESMDNLIDELDSDDDAVAERAMNTYRVLKDNFDQILKHLPEFNRINGDEERAKRKRVAKELRRLRAERKGTRPPD